MIGGGALAEDEAFTGVSEPGPLARMPVWVSRPSSQERELRCCAKASITCIWSAVKVYRRQS